MSSLGLSRLAALSLQGGPDEPTCSGTTTSRTFGSAQVIVAATKSAAEFVHLADAGTVQANKRADFIVLDANPLTDITNTRKISAVYLAGSAVDREGLRKTWTSSDK